MVAYLQAEDQAIRDQLAAGLAATSEPKELLELLVVSIGDLVCGAGFHGCPFINAAAEFPDPTSAVHQVVLTHRAWFRQSLTDLLAAAGHDDPAAGAQTLVMLRDGAMAGGYLDDSQTVRAGLAHAVEIFIARQ